MLRVLVAGVFFAALLGVSLGALLPLLPYAKEGGSPEIAFLLLVLVLVVLLGTALAWWRICNWSGAGRLLSALGLLPLALPVTVHVAAVASGPYHAFRRWQYARLSTEVAGRVAAYAEVVKLEEAPIVWKGFDGPTSVRLTIELVHKLPQPWSTYLSSPMITRSGRGTLSAADIDHHFGYGEFPDRSETDVLGLGRYPNAELVQGSRRTERTYELRPNAWNMQVFPPDGAQICFRKGVPSRWPVALPTEPPIGLWYYFVSDDKLYVDLSPVLTTALREKAAIVNDAEEWQRMHARLQPEALARYGHKPCELANDQSAFPECYCLVE